MLHKIVTLWEYARTGIRLGADLRSKLVLASMLWQLKLMPRSYGSKVHTVMIRMGGMVRWLYFRPQDIFIIHEVLGHCPYIVPDFYDEAPRCIVDLGAHIGLATLLFKAHFPNSIVHCYEPDPDNYELLILNTKGLEGIMLYKIAVGGFSGETYFYVRPHRHASSSLRKPGDESYTAISCTVRTLDEILTSTPKVDLIKFDIEGTEWEVFGTSTLVRQVRYIVGELKADEQTCREFLQLFPDHESLYRTSAPRMWYLYLKRR